MSSRITHLAAPAAFLVAAFGLATSASALTVGECSTQYQAAKAANGLNGQTWQQFLATCRAQPAAATAPAPAPAAAPAPAKPVVAAPAPAAPKPPVAAAPAPAPVAGAAVFPTAISAQYASLKPGKQRENTCLDQYKANKTTNGNGGLTWIQKGGGYYSQCNKRLKGE